jgi:chromosome partitioning protein
VTAPTHAKARPQTVALVNQKGGVGKTATCAGIGGALAEAGRRVLLVDLDPQGSLSTVCLRVPTPAPDAEATLPAALTGQWTGDPSELVVTHSETGTGGRLDVLPTTVGMFTLARELDQLRAREHRLARLLARLPGPDDPAGYHHILIDCPPTLDVLVDGALTAADAAVIPVQAEDSSLHALELLLSQIAAIEAELRDAPLNLYGLVVSMLDRGRGGMARSTIGRSVVDVLAQQPLPILATIPRGAVIAEAWRFGTPVTTYAPRSEHAAAYRAIARVIDPNAPVIDMDSERAVAGGVA